MLGPAFALAYGATCATGTLELARRAERLEMLGAPGDAPRPLLAEDASRDEFGR